MPLRGRAIAAYVAGCLFFLDGCMGGHHPIYRADLVGSYEAKADTWIGRPSHEAGERLTLRADGTYELTRPSQDRGTPGKVGHWEFTDTGTPEVELDHAGYPVRFNRHAAELVIDDDINARYERLK